MQTSRCNFEERLSRMETLWTLVRQAHGNGSDRVGADRAADINGVDEVNEVKEVNGVVDVASAQWRLLERYRGAVFRYLIGAVRDAEAAEELFQEFALRFVRGDFHRATPDRGRFRDYLRTVLINLVNDYHNQRKSSPRPLPVDLADPGKNRGAADGTGAGTDDSGGGQDAGRPPWESRRKQLIERAWAQMGTSQPAGCAALQLQLREPGLGSPEMARRLSRQLGKPMTATGARVALCRARDKFARLLVEEVRRSLAEPTEEQLVAALRRLRLLRHCERVLWLE